MAQLSFTLLLLEAMDKKPDVLVFWSYAAISGYVGWKAARRTWWRGVPILALISMSFIAARTQWRDRVKSVSLICYRDGAIAPDPS